jgi:FKBP-type peptidyl-prolyl cis-trans isomerase
MRRLLLLLAVTGVLLCGCGSDRIDPLPDPGATGLKIEDLHVGTGLYPVQGQTVTVSYTGTLLDGTKFDSTTDRGQDFQFRLGAGAVIRGMDQGVATMKIGGHRKLTIPPDLAYGAQGSPPAIPPNATIVFDVWLIAAS